MKYLNKKGLMQEGGQSMQPQADQQMQQQQQQMQQQQKQKQQQQSQPSLSEYITNAMNDQGMDISEVLDELRFNDVDDEQIYQALIELGYSQDVALKLARDEKGAQSYVRDTSMFQQEGEEENPQAKFGTELVDFFRNYNDTPYGFYYGDSLDPVAAIKGMIGGVKQTAKGLGIGKKNKAYKDMMYDYDYNPEKFVKENTYINIDPKTGKVQTLTGYPELFDDKQRNMFINQGQKLTKDFKLSEEQKQEFGDIYRKNVVDNIKVMDVPGIGKIRVNKKEGGSMFPELSDRQMMMQNFMMMVGGEQLPEYQFLGETPPPGDFGGDLFLETQRTDENDNIISPFTDEYSTEIRKKAAKNKGLLRDIGNVGQGVFDFAQGFNDLMDIGNYERQKSKLYSSTMADNLFRIDEPDEGYYDANTGLLQPNYKASNYPTYNTGPIAQEGTELPKMQDDGEFKPYIEKGVRVKKDYRYKPYDAIRMLQGIDYDTEEKQNIKREQGETFDPQKTGMQLRQQFKPADRAKLLKLMRKYKINPDIQTFDLLNVKTTSGLPKDEFDKQKNLQQYKQDFINQPAFKNYQINQSLSEGDFEFMVPDSTRTKLLGQRKKLTKEQLDAYEDIFRQYRQNLDDEDRKERIRIRDEKSDLENTPEGDATYEAVMKYIQRNPHPLGYRNRDRFGNPGAFANFRIGQQEKDTGRYYGSTRLLPQDPQFASDYLYGDPNAPIFGSHYDGVANYIKYFDEDGNRIYAEPETYFEDNMILNAKEKMRYGRPYTNPKYRGKSDLFGPAGYQFFGAGFNQKKDYDMRSEFDNKAWVERYNDLLERRGKGEEKIIYNPKPERYEDFYEQVRLLSDDQLKNIKKRQLAEDKFREKYKFVGYDRVERQRGGKVQDNVYELDANMIAKLIAAGADIEML